MKPHLARPPVHDSADFRVPRAIESPRGHQFHWDYGAVTEEHAIALFAHHVKAVRWAQYIGCLSRPAADDVVSDVFLSIWTHRAPPGPGYLFRAVTHGALRVHGYAWARYVVALDPRDLVLAEQATFTPTQPALAVPQGDSGRLMSGATLGATSLRRRVSLHITPAQKVLRPTRSESADG